MWTNLRKRLLALHKDEGGADMVEYILLIAIVALPLLGFLLFYRGKIMEWVTNWWNDLSSQANNGVNG